MRINLITLFLLLMVITANCQVALSVQAGGNLTTAHDAQTNNYGDYKTRAGWQAAFNIRYGLASKHWFAYSGLGLENKSLRYQTTDYQNPYTGYKPLFLTLPLGIGYTYTYTKNFSINFYTGLYGSFGIGGKYFSKQVDYCDFVACPENVHITDRSIHFGNSRANGNDLTRTNWGAQFGVGLSAWRRFEVACLYNFGLSNILPADDLGEKLYLRSLSVDVKMNIKTFKQPNKNK